MNTITKEHIDSKIEVIEYIRGPGTLTFCVITLENGFTVTGNAACVDPNNFDAEMGQQIAYENACDEIWALEGYLLKQRIFENGQS